MYIRCPPVQVLTKLNSFQDEEICLAIVISLEKDKKGTVRAVGLQFNDPVNTIMVVLSQLVYLSTLFLGKLSPLSS